MEAENIIEVSHLSKSYKLYDRKIDRLKEAFSITNKQYRKPFYALKDISFSVRRGETFGIIGTNGSGKSTLLKILTGVVSQSDGYFQVDGKVSALLELGAGFNPEYTGMENIILQGMMMGYTKEEMESKTESIIQFADIGSFIYQPVKIYSSGMFARLAFAVAISVEPDILIVDEALSVGDIFFQNRCFRKFKELERKGVTILFVSHDIETVKQMCARTLWIEKGTVQKFGSSKEVCNAYSSFILNKNNKCACLNDMALEEYESHRLELSSFPGITKYGSESILHSDVAIRAFFFEDMAGKPVYTLEGGERYRLIIVFEAIHELENVIVGFVLQTKKGLILINSNSLVTGKERVFHVTAGSLNRVEFTMKLPYLASEEYILDCAIAQGTTVNESKMLTWLYGALRVFIENPLGNLGILDIHADVDYYTRDN